MSQLEKELESYGDADPVKYEENKRAVILSKEAALRWTGRVNVDDVETTLTPLILDNYCIILSHFCRERGVDPEEIRRHFGVPGDYEDIY